MARVFTDGAEFQDLLFFDTPSTTSISTSVKRSGEAAYQVTNGPPTKNIPALSELYFRFSVHSNLANTVTSRIIDFRKGTTVIDGVYVNGTSGFLEARMGGSTVLATGTHPFLATTHYLIEVHIKISDAGGVFDIKVDGVSDLTFSGDTKPGADTNVDNFIIGRSAGSNTFTYDDFALNDTSGTVDNSWCGDGKVILLTPNGNGDVTQLLGSDGNQTDNYLLVDEFPNDGDTTYVVGSGVGNYDLYALIACGLTSVEIKRVWAEARARGQSATGDEIGLIVKTNSVEYQSPNYTLLTSYTPIIASGFLNNPNTSSPWTTTELDALQVGVEIV